ncbi:MAG: hypothetical protein Q7W05_14200 [Deltaproteobacteria bacterium]|nr:hypothetical protein [Deltaproteobacteria bacterium]
MNTRRPQWVIAASIVTLIATTYVIGCNDSDGTRPDIPDTVIDNLYAACFADSGSCIDATVSVKLYLDTINLPNPAGGNLYLYMQAYSGVGGQHNVLAYEWPGSFPDSLLNELAGEQGWKVTLANMGIEFCDSCYDNGGYVRQIILVGPDSSVSFVYDPADTLEIFVVLD